MVNAVAKYQKYAEYKNSGVEWLGEIPCHWEAIKFAYVIDKVGDIDHYMPNSVDHGIPYVMTGDLKDRVSLIDFSSCKKVNEIDYKNLSKKIKTQRDDVILARYATIGTVSYVDIDADFLVSYSCVTIKPKVTKVSGKYLFNYLKSDAFIQSIQMQVNSNTQGNVGVDSLRSVKVIMPSLQEQAQIINFLDHETAKIDSLIEKQQKLIELLKEKRQAAISHAVTKGLNPDMPMKDSGVEWLGQVPEHWETTKIKYVAELTPKKGELLNTDNRLCTFVPMEKLKLGSLIKDEEKPISEVIGGYTYFRDGDLLLAKVTPCFENKNMVIASGLKNGIGFGSSEIYVLRSNSKVDSQFLYYRLQEDQFMELGVGSMTGAGGLKRVPSEFLNNFEFCLPPLKEQLTITEYLNQYLIKSELLMNKAESAIQLMQERRTALISSAVTGKIDVRYWQNPNHKNEA